MELNYLNIARVIVLEHLRAEFNTAHAQRAGTNINIWFPHVVNFQESIINYGCKSFKNLYCFWIKLVGNLMDLILLFAVSALHANLSAHS